MPRPYAVNDYWTADDQLLSLLRYAEVLLETTMDGRTFNPPTSMCHLPLLCIAGALDPQRNLMDWIDTLVRGIAAASRLQGKKGQAQRVEND